METQDFIDPTILKEIDSAGVEEMFQCNDVFLYKQMWSEDGYFLPQIKVANGSRVKYQVLHFTSRQEVRIIITDEFDMLCCNHIISPDFKYTEFEDPNCSPYYGFTWRAQSKSNVCLMSVSTSYAYSCKIIDAVNSAKDLAVKYKEEFDQKETLRRQLMSDSECSDDQSDGTKVDEDQSQCSLFEDYQSESSIEDHNSQAVTASMEKKLDTQENNVKLLNETNLTLKKITGYQIQENKNGDTNMIMPEYISLKDTDSLIKIEFKKLYQMLSEKDMIIEKLSKNIEILTQKEDGTVTDIKKLTRCIQEMKNELNASVIIVKDKEINRLTAAVEDYVSKLQEMQTDINKKNTEKEQLALQLEKMLAEISAKDCKIEEFNLRRQVAKTMSEKRDVFLNSLSLTLIDLKQQNPMAFVTAWEQQLTQQMVPNYLWVSAVRFKALPDVLCKLFDEKKYDTENWDLFKLSFVYVTTVFTNSNPQ